MARTVRDARLDSRSARARLAQGGPFYRGLDPGLHLGYRKGQTGGKWVVRWRGDDAGAYKVETIGTADDTADADGVAVLSYAQAQEAARKRRVVLDRAAKGLPAERGGLYTVKACIDEYLGWLEENRKSARDARWRAEALILPTLGNIFAAELTKQQIETWRDATAKAPPRLRTRIGKPQQHRAIDDGDEEQRRKRRSATNRVLTTLKAALNRAWRDGKIASDDAWRRVEPFGEAGAARVRYLSIDECRRLINATDGEFRDLVEAALTTGCRFGELAALQCRDFNADSGTLHIRQSKSGKDRHVVLADEGIALFGRLTAGRPGPELVLRKSNDDRWGKSGQFRPMNEACERGKIEPAANFHALRHTYASHMVMAGAPLLVVAKNLGHTDTRMVEKHYGHFSDSYVASAIREAAPRFGIGGGNVTPIAAGRER
jgi:integrase